ncbi:MAG: undecaprenyl-diphosphate phosphatase [Dehalococcoidia bacterium]
MEDLLRAVALGIVQGLTEFLPISSSGHLILTREFFGWNFSDDLTFDVALHLGTTIAVISFFGREWVLMLRGGLAWLSNGGREPDPDPVYNSRLLFLLALGSIPAAIVGLIFDLALEDEVRSPYVVGGMLIAFGLLLYVGDRYGSRRRAIQDSTWRDAVWIGAAQALSLVPGVSRAGVTITAAMYGGYRRPDAARFSFLLSTPVIVGAGLLKITEAVVDGIPRDDVVTILAGAVVAAVVGWLAIRYLLQLLRTGTFLPFVVYRLTLGAFVLGYFAL